MTHRPVIKNRYLYLPLEIFNRELNGMLLLSLIAATKGWQVLIGGKKTIFPHLEDFPEGVVLLKSIVPGEIHIQDRISSLGHKVTSLDAEGLIPSNGRSGVELRYSKESIQKSDLLFFWGKAQYEQVKMYYPDILKNGIVTGSPIFDYWRLLKKSQIENNKDKPKVVLIATSFPYANHYIDPEQAYDSVRNASGKDATDNHLEEIFLDGKLQEVVYPNFKIMVGKLAKKLPNHKIILRPHPSENPNTWKHIADENENVELQSGGEISRWLLKCDYFIHFNSTTSIEAFFYNKTVITYLPEIEENLHSRLSVQALNVSNVCHELDQIIGLILNGKKMPHNEEFNLETIIEQAKSDEIAMSSRNIIDAFEKLDVKGTHKRLPSKYKLLLSKGAILNKVKLRLIWIIGWIDYLFNLFSGKYATHKDYYKYGKTKQGKIYYKFLNKKLISFCRILKIDENTFALHKLKSGLFCIKQK